MKSCAKPSLPPDVVREGRRSGAGKEAIGGPRQAETIAQRGAFAVAPEYPAPLQLRLTPAAVGRNVTMLERNFGVRLFQRSTSRLVLIEASQRFLLSIGDTLGTLKQFYASTVKVLDVGVTASAARSVARRSRATTKKKNVIRPSLIQCCRERLYGRAESAR